MFKHKLHILVILYNYKSLIASRFIPHIAGKAERTLEPSVKAVRAHLETSVPHFYRILEALRVTVDWENSTPRFAPLLEQEIKIVNISYTTRFTVVRLCLCATSTSSSITYLLNLCIFIIGKFIFWQHLCCNQYDVDAGIMTCSVLFGKINFCHNQRNNKFNFPNRTKEIIDFIWYQRLKRGFIFSRSNLFL